ncbi:DsrE family protein [Parasphingopyxis lamellibrachiae]|uniref:Intracellular sulfur oxidation DsrE/DsrF family protein n=1 Tax=Parasphingopyxis lamellibrachiae TaxID=680125 RepID=A0A3D9FJD7_9SPHN|nr:DsrE family protein [Parasphingopyxis lamellibrachiae]RED17697.1 intracellular sulfur oxidation DsrE/DsrF family protein [Parasphingopyxis lamellibrachiae]
MLKPALALIGLSLAATPLAAQYAAFHSGPVYTQFGRIADVTTTMAIPADAEFAVVFDTSTQAEPGEINRTIDSAARFINMHVAAGVPPENIRIAVVVHGQAAFDMTNAERYGAHYDGAENVNVAAVEALVANNVQIIVCGQTAAYYEIDVEYLLPGVDMALSAMTAHALLQQDGFTVNPF